MKSTLQLNCYALINRHIHLKFSTSVKDGDEVGSERLYKTTSEWVAEMIS